MTFIHPFDDAVVMAGQGAIGLELLEQVPRLGGGVGAIGGGGGCGAGGCGRCGAGGAAAEEDFAERCAYRSDGVWGKYRCDVAEPDYRAWSGAGRKNDPAEDSFAG